MLSENIPLADYERLTEVFHPTAFDAREICRRAKAWGMKYLCFTAKHHDGYALFDSAADEYNSVSRSACGRDFVRELADACAAEGLVFCLYYSQAQDWHHPDGYRAYQDNSGRNFRRCLDEKCIPQLRELLTNYGKIGMIWFDTPMGMRYEESKELVDLVKTLQPECLVNGRIGHGLGDYLTTQDNRIPAYPIKTLWEVPATMNSSWGYKHWDHNWHSPQQLVRRLLDIVSRGGNYLLNIGPRGDGSVPEECMKRLDEAGRLLRPIGPAIYGTKARESYVYEAPELRFTHKDHYVYLHLLEPQRFKGRMLPLPNIKNTPVSQRWLNASSDAENALTLTQSLEGDPVWRLHVPEDTEAEDILTLEVKTKEKDFLQKYLDE